jgi:hypothetical protein
MTTHDETAYRDQWDDATEARLRALGIRTPRCRVPRCEEHDPFALSGVHPDLVCDEHLADELGHSWMQDHHLAGKANDAVTAPVPGNDHRQLSARQQLWPRDTLRNPDGSPLLRAAAALRGWLDILRLIIEKTVGWVPPLLESLDQALRDKLGPVWWQDLGWQG